MDGVVPANPALAATPPAPRRAEPKALTCQEVRQLLRIAKGDPLEALFHTAVDTGLRFSELARLTWWDVDLDAGRLTVLRGLHFVPRRGWVKHEPKSKPSWGTIDLHPRTVEVLQKHRQAWHSAREAAAKGGTWSSVPRPGSRCAIIAPFGPCERC